MGPNGSQWVPMGPNGSQWVPAIFNRSERVLIDSMHYFIQKLLWERRHEQNLSGSQWVPMGPNGSQWVPLGPSGSQWVLGNILMQMLMKDFK